MKFVLDMTYYVLFSRSKDDRGYMQKILCSLALVSS